VVPAQAAFLAKQGTRTVFITGSTGESHSVTTAEKLTLYEAWAASAGELRVIAHVGSNCIEDAKILARRAEELGFLAISALAPSYYKPGGLTGLIDCCAAIAAAAPKTPFYYYDIPVLTGVMLPMEKFLIEAKAAIPNLAGIKFTNQDLVSYRRSLDVAGDEFDLPWGVDEMLLAGLATGARGGVGSTYNWAPELYRKLTAAFHRGDLTEARRLQSISIAMIDLIAATGFLGTAKALMARLCVPVGPARLPLGNPSSAQVDSLMEKLDALGFQEWGAKPL
jgi:N-acetylneuraminate lyase